MTSQKTLVDALKELGETSSLHGVPKILSSRQLAVKILWCILLVGAIGLSTFQIIGLFDEYWSYPVKTSVTLNYAKLPFPAVTICNINPIRLSKLKDNEEMNDILLKKLEFESSGNPWDAIASLYDSLDLLDDVIPEEYDSFFRNRSGFEAWQERVLAAYKRQPPDKRDELGHRFEDMLHHLTFLGFSYDIDDGNKVIQMFSPLFGNCYIIDLNEMAQTSGSTKGLHMVLNLEKSEYIDHFVNGYGMRLSVHERGTIPIPDRDSFVLNPGYETNIAVKMVRINRLGGNYGKCIDGGRIQADSDIVSVYSIPVCHMFCERDHILEICGCIPFGSIDEVHPNNVTADVCDVDDFNVMDCVTSVEDRIYFGELECDCPPRCKEDTYTVTISGRSWPNAKYLERVLIPQSCSNYTPSMEKTCKQFKADVNITNSNYYDYASNFLSVNVYFEDLTYETISEEPLYNTMRFLSDLGGAMGFYMGASLLTYVEILQLILELCLFWKSKMTNKTKPFDTVQVSVKPNQDKC